jgi:bifunctional non-homologous end joining protein LigD
MTRSKPLKPRVKGRPQRPAFTSTERVIFPDAGYTKGDILEFHERIAPWLLPHLKDRPITLERLPAGLTGPKAPHFWQKNTPEHYPSWIPRINLPTEEGKPVDYLLVNDIETLLYLVNQGTITFHVYFSTIDCLECPDFVAFDLDVSGSTFANAVTIAKQFHKELDQEGITSHPKTSGKTGLHIFVPWGKREQQRGYDEARAWALEIAERVCAALPDLATTERLKARRGKRVYVDVMQNALGHHVVPPYVLRATPLATVSTPLEWKQVNAKLDPKRFDIRTVFKQLDKFGADPFADVR